MFRWKSHNNNTNIGNINVKLDSNKSALQNVFKKSTDVVYYEFETKNKQRYLIVYVDDLINKEVLDRDVVGAILKESNSQTKTTLVTPDYLKSIIHFTNIKESNSINEVVNKLVSGNAVIFTEGLGLALCLPSQYWNQRSISEPDSEVISKGPREGFVETLKTNRSMIRRKIQNPNLQFESLQLGKQTNTTVNIIYIDNIVHKGVLEELKKRLQKIDIDGILDTEYIKDFIVDKQITPFNTIGYTERPDVLVARLLEGRIAILCDGTPTALTIPFLFLENMQSNEDYYTNYFAASINRIIRYISFTLTVFVPGFYVALISYHHEFIPSKLLFGLIAARIGVPFPSIFEVLGMILVFEILRESGLRLPKGLGQTVSIVGALVLGQAAVEAKLISAPVVIIIAITAITSFMFYKMNGAIMTLRFIVTLLSSFFGLYGTILGFIGVFIHLYSLRTFGVPYMSYIGTFKNQEIKDTIVRAPWWYMSLRPRLISRANITRNKG